MRRVLMLILSLCLLSAVSLPAQDKPRVVHVFVALADNVNQGIVPVPKRLGNGEDAANNLYWGSAYGVKTFFARSPDWRLIASIPSPRSAILERLVFRHRRANVYLVADAYRGREIKQAIVEFLAAAAGEMPQAVPVRVESKEVVVSGGGNADLVAYIGHNGLMDFQLTSTPSQKNDRPRSAIILACASKQYFAPALRQTGADPLVWTTNLMAPEAYTLEAALDGWIENESDEQVRERAAVAYDKYQKCGVKAARRLLVTGW
jgi:hypothetical protein